MLEARDQASGPFFSFHIEGGVNIHLNGQNKNPIASNLLVTALANSDALKDALTKRAPGPAKPEAPSVIVRNAAQPLKIMRDGHRVDARDSVTDHIALLFPETDWMIGVDTLYRGEKNPFASQQDTVAAAKAITLLDYDDWGLADDIVYGRHIIDRRFFKPAADPNLYPRLLLTDTYWTSTVTPWSESSAFFVSIYSGYVCSNGRGSSGFGLPCRRARQ